MNQIFSFILRISLHGVCPLFILLTVLIPSSSLAEVTQADYDNIVGLVHKTYNDEFLRRYGRPLKIRAEYDNPSLDATMYEADMFIAGGWAARSETVQDMIALTLCHEIGHALGGAPRIQGGSVEGQADYFATLKCTRRIWAHDDNESALRGVKIDPIVEQKCADAHSVRKDQLICMRSSMAAKLLLENMCGPGTECGIYKESPVSFETPDLSVYSGTNRKKFEMRYPDIQCRLDTMFAGALCNKGPDEKLNDYDDAKGACNAPEVGARPACWYLSQPR